MANYTALISAVQAVIKENGNKEITGFILQSALTSIINVLGAGYQFMGEATPSTNPGTPDARVFYLASTAGTYSNFGGRTLTSGQIALFLWSSSWTAIIPNIPSKTYLDDTFLKKTELATIGGIISINNGEPVATSAAGEQLATARAIAGNPRITAITYNFNGTNGIGNGYIEQNVYRYLHTGGDGYECMQVLRLNYRKYKRYISLSSSPGRDGCFDVLVVGAWAEIS